MSHPPNGASPISVPQVLLQIAPDVTEDETLPEKDSVVLPAADAASYDNEKPKTSSRQPHVFTDASGTEKTFGSALGLLTRKFVDIVMASPSGAVDMNETASLLEVPKRRIYDITNVLEGVGILEKRSKNTVAWKGSEAILGTTIESDAKEHIEQLRTEITIAHKEEAMLDQWIHHVLKMPGQAPPMHAADILQGLFYPNQQDKQTPRETVVDDTGKPRRALLAVHAHYDTVVHIPTPSPQQQSPRLYVGTRSGIDRYEPASSSSSSQQQQPNNNNKRKPVLVMQSRKGVKMPRAEDRIHVYSLSTYFDYDKNQLCVANVRTLTDDPTLQKDTKIILLEDEDEMQHNKPRSHSWDVAESLAEEGVSDFFGAAEEEV